MIGPRRPRILVLGKYYPPHPGGIEEFVRQMFELASPAFEVTVLVHASDKTGADVIRGVSRVRHVGTWGVLASQPISPGMMIEILRQPADLIHLHAPNPLAALLVAICRAHTPLVVTHHADIVGFGLAGRCAVALYRRLLRRARAVTVLSPRNRALARDLEGVDIPCLPLPIAFNEEDFAATDAVRARASELRAAVPKDGVVFLFVGRLVAYKGVDILLEALSGCDPSSRLFVVGDGPQRAELERQTRWLGLRDRVLFFGHVQHEAKLAALMAADVFVLPSVTSAEAFGLVQVEAQLCALPVIATRLPTGVTDVTLDGETGLIVEPGDPASLADAMTRLAGDADLRKTLGAAGLKRARAHYTRPAVRRALRRLYENALRS